MFRPGSMPRMRTAVVMGTARVYVRMYTSATIGISPPSLHLSQPAAIIPRMLLVGEDGVRLARRNGHGMGGVAGRGGDDRLGTHRRGRGEYPPAAVGSIVPVGARA